MLSRFFIDRPVFACVISIVIVIAGILGVRSLPISQYPDVVPPEVNVTASYPGASAEEVAETVAAPLEKAINGTDDMLYQSSTSSDSGNVTISVTFAVGTDPDQATINVNNRVQSARSKLPATVQKTGVKVRKRSTNVLQVVMLYSPEQTFDTTYISNYALVNVINALKRVKGVGQAQLFSNEDYSMRIWLNPAKMARYNLTTTDVKTAIEGQNSQFAAGQFGAKPYGNADTAFTFKASAQGRFSEAKQFKDIILRAKENGKILRLKDVARVELGAQTYSTGHAYNGQPAVPMAIYLSPGSNALATADRVRDRMAELKGNMPNGLSYKIPFNTTQFVRASIEEVVFTLVISLALVMAVIFTFLQNVRATLIPMAAVPVALLGTFAGIYELGFSINLLTLFGMILAIGMVVDDAIIVIENVERHMSEEGRPAREAAIVAMREVTGPVIAVVLALNAVFIPVGFLGGLSGEMYRQFAITIAMSIAISGFVALTLTPALCALFLKKGQQQPWLPFRLFNKAFSKLTGAYLWGVNFLLRHALIGIMLFAGVLGATWIASQQVPPGLIPQEDQGYVFAIYRLPPASSLQRTQEASAKLSTQIRKQMPGVKSVVRIPGFDFLAGSTRTFAGIAFVTLKEWSEREASSFDQVKKIMGIGAHIPSAQIVSLNPPPIIGLSTTGGFEGYLQAIGGADYNTLKKQADKLSAAANKNPKLAGVKTTLTTNVPRYHVDVDREKAKTLGVPVSNVFDTLQATFGRLFVNRFTMLGRNWQVNLQADAPYRMKPKDLAGVYVQSQTTDKMIPVSSLVSTERVTGPDIVERYNVFPAAKIRGGAAPGYSSGQANQAIKQVANNVIDKGYRFQFTGTAYQAEKSGDSQLIALSFGVVMVFLILAAQYEQWTLPLAVIVAVPFAALGAFVAIWVFGVNNNVYFTVGMLVLIGLAAKNAILIVEFAVLERRNGKTPAEAAYAAAELRFRPIVMTSLTFILASTPLITATGPSSNSRVAIGATVIGGMLAATAFAILFVPLAYDLLQRSSEAVSRRRHDDGSGGGPPVANVDTDHRVTDETDYKLPDQRNNGGNNHE
ncbi:efflux RND transporter permease subunit [Salinisphaera sp. USBA-960]|nr:efflux RND transporter permease subunit [Salifodinibacter halophilus]NNC26488.1 efflux RND transporter permease subunit [Salifodinibacter halophilus]